LKRIIKVFSILATIFTTTGLILLFAHPLLDITVKEYGVLAFFILPIALVIGLIILIIVSFAQSHK